MNRNVLALAMMVILAGCAAPVPVAKTIVEWRDSGLQDIPPLEEEYVRFASFCDNCHAPKVCFSHDAAMVTTENGSGCGVMMCTSGFLPETPRCTQDKLRSWNDGHRDYYCCIGGPYETFLECFSVESQ